MTFEPLMSTDEGGIEAMSALATEIVREHYDPILGTAQNDYMLEKFQSVNALREQLAHGYQYCFVRVGDRRVGFLAFYPKENCLYLSKFYLLKAERGKGYARQMHGFVCQKAQEVGLSAVELNVNKNNSAVFAYEKLGFERVRAEKIDIGAGYYMDDYVYRYTITDHGSEKRKLC